MHIPKSLLLATVAYLAISASKTLAKDSDDAAKLREAMRQKLAEEKIAQTAPAQATPAAPAKPAAPAATAKPVTPATPAAPVKPTPAPAPVKPATQASATDSVVVGDDPEDAALRETMHARMADKAVPAAAPAEPAPAPTKPAKPAPSKAKPAKAASTPMQTPASPLAGSKEERLKHLLDQYKADQITPEEYHKQRAKIVAE